MMDEERDTIQSETMENGKVRDEALKNVTGGSDDKAPQYDIICGACNGVRYTTSDIGTARRLLVQTHTSSPICPLCKYTAVCKIVER